MRFYKSLNSRENPLKAGVRAWYIIIKQGRRNWVQGGQG